MMLNTYIKEQIQQKIPFSEFKSRIENNEINVVQLKTDSYIGVKGQILPNGQLEADGPVYITVPVEDPSFIELLDRKNVIYTAIKEKNSYITDLLLGWIVPFAFLMFIWRFMLKKIGGPGADVMTFGRNKAQIVAEGDTGITFDDVAGADESKEELEEVVDFLKNPKRYTDIGGKVPKGVLLVGPPGTGKTLLAKAVAGTAGVPSFRMSGSDFVEMFVGVGAARVRDLFKQAREKAPCIVFIDELDAIGKSRMSVAGGNDEREQTLNQLLVEMDGFDSTTGVILLAATNRPDVLDPALLRPGRFDRQVVVDMPDIKEREDILNIHAKKIPIGPDVDLKRIARATPGTSGADIANLVNEAALFAARKDKKIVNMVDFEEARDKILLGVARKSRVISAEEKKATAYHEAGHALLHYYLENADPLHKVTVIPHGRALGMALSLPEREIYSRNREWLLDRIKISLGGYVAETIIFGSTTTGTQNDLKQATQIARKMVCEWGMSEKLGPVALGQEDEPIFIGKEIAQHKDYSEETARAIDEEIREIIRKCYHETKEILSENRDKLERLSDTLIIKETLDDYEIRDLLGITYRNKNIVIEKQFYYETADSKTEETDSSLKSGNENENNDEKGEERG